MLEIAKKAFILNLGELEGFTNSLWDKGLFYIDKGTNKLKFELKFRILENDMPAKSKRQQQAMAIAEHEPKKLYKRNKGLKKMSKSQLHDYAATKTKGLPKKVKKK
jgi:hypothetical protein